MWRASVGPTGREDGPVDVRGESVVVDEHADPDPSGRSCGEYVQPEMERSVLRNVVVGDRVGNRQAGDALAVAGFDDDAQSAVAVAPIGAIGCDIKIPTVRARRMRNVRGW
jgi:hypothetical protein